MAFQNLALDARAEAGFWIDRASERRIVEGQMKVRIAKLRNYTAQAPSTLISGTTEVRIPSLKDSTCTQLRRSFYNKLSNPKLDGETTYADFLRMLR